MRQRMSKPFEQMCMGVAALTLALLVTLWPAATLAKDHSQIALSPSNGGVNTPITISGKNFPAFCGGVILIDNDLTNTVYACDSSGAFQSHLTWPDGLDDGKHTINARGTFSSAQATFTQIAVTPTPNATATAAVDATATASAAQATATAGAAQSTATANVPTATPSTNGAATGVGNTTTPTSNGLSPALMGMLLVASLLLIAGGVLLALALSNRHQAPHGLPAPAYRPVPPPPPPLSDATLPQGEQWIWPNDPHRR